MCTVQVLLLADVTRPYAPVRPGLPPPRSICRRLFAEDDSQPRPSRLLGALEADLERQVRERWNFDFRTGTPLPGRYQWVSVRPGVRDRVPRADSVVTEVPQKTEDRPSSRQAEPKTTTTHQSKITDFLLQRKRHRTVESDLACNKLKSRRLDTATTTTPPTVN